MDKLIEAAQGIIDYARVDRLSGYCMVPLMAVENLKAAVRAHDAGTDEELRKAIHILRTTPITPEHGFECGTECGARVGKRELHLKWHATLFPKTGGAK